MLWKSKKYQDTSKGSEIYQMISQFLYTFSSGSKEFLERFEGNCEYMIEIFWFMITNNYEFGYDLFDDVKLSNEYFLQNCVIHIIKLIGNNTNPVTIESRAKLENEKDITLLERFYCYLCWACASYSKQKWSKCIRKLLDHACGYFDFINNGSIVSLMLCNNFTEKVFKAYEDTDH